MENDSRKWSESNTVPPDSPFNVKVEQPESVYETVGNLGTESLEEVNRSRRGHGTWIGGKLWQIISNHYFDDKLFYSEETKIGGQHHDREGTIFALNTRVHLSELRKQNSSHGYFSDKMVGLVKDLLITSGLDVNLKKENEENCFYIATEGVKINVFFGYPSKETEEAYIRNNKIFGDRRKKMHDGLVNKSFCFQLGGNEQSTVFSQKLESEQNFKQIIQAYADVYGKLINAIYRAEDTECPKNTILLCTQNPIKTLDENPSRNNVDIQDEGIFLAEGFESIAGQDNAVTEAKKLVQAIKNPEIYQKRGVRIPKGILLYGPPGTGKTLLAKAIAKESGAIFIDVSVADIGSKWHGESEKMMQDIFNKAKSKRKTILFFDEFDSLVPPRSDSYEVTRKIIAVFNQNMDGIRSDTNITVIAATNRPEGIDLAAKRSGRFDKLIEMGLPNETGRILIFQKHIEKAKTNSTETESLFSNNLDWEQIGRETNGMSGADIANIVNRTLEEKLTKELEGELWTPVNTGDILDTVYQMSIERTEKTEIKFNNKK